MKHPDEQVVPLHTSPEPHFVPLGAADHAVVDLAGVQTWHGLAGFAVPGAWNESADEAPRGAVPARANATGRTVSGDAGHQSSRG